MNTSRRVVISGMGVLSPIGNSLPEFRQQLLSGQSGAGPVSYFDASPFATRFACEIKGLQLSDHFDSKTIRRNDPFTLYALIAAREAMQQACFSGLAEADRNRFGVIWASGNGGVISFQKEMEDYQPENPRFRPTFIPKTLYDAPSGALALEFGLRGINYCTVSACASGTSAIMDAFNYIRWGKADRILAGGSEAPVCEAWLGGFSSMKALSTRNNSPQTASRPLAGDRDGFVLGEGAAALVVESLESAQARGATIIAEIVGGGMSADAHHATAPHPEGLGALLAMEMALEEAGISALQLDHINLHATSTPAGDRSEVNALKRLLGEGLKDISLSATKSMTGHLLGAAGALEAVITALSVKEDVIPPTINTQKIDPEFPASLRIYPSSKQKPVNYALSNSFGFGGHNAALVLKKYEG